MSWHLASARTSRPAVPVRLAAAVCAGPDGLCTVERETPAHPRVFTGCSRAAMARTLGMAEETYRRVETTGKPGQPARGRYSEREERWLAREE